MIGRDGVRWRLVAHAIVSREGRICAADGTMPPCLIVPEDQARFRAALEGAALTILGREGHERHPRGTRRRLVLTSRVGGLEAEGDGVLLWNPAGAPLAGASPAGAPLAGASLADALARLAPRGGTAVVAGGTGVMTTLLPVTDAFELAVAHGCAIPGGRPCLTGADDIAAIETRLRDAGLVLGDMTELVEGVELRRFERGAA